MFLGDGRYQRFYWPSLWQGWHCPLGMVSRKKQADAGERDFCKRIRLLGEKLPRWTRNWFVRLKEWMADVEYILHLNRSRQWLLLEIGARRFMENKLGWLLITLSKWSHFCGRKAEVGQSNQLVVGFMQDWNHPRLRADYQQEKEQ